MLPSLLLFILFYVFPKPTTQSTSVPFYCDVSWLGLWAWPQTIFIPNPDCLWEEICYMKFSSGHHCHCSFLFFAATCTLRSLIHNAQIEKGLKTKISLTFSDKTRTHMRLFIMCIHLAYCEFLCFICRVLNAFVTGCCFRTPWRCDMICRICTALPFHTPRISDSKTHPGLWSCNQEFLLKSRDELFCC